MIRIRANLPVPPPPRLGCINSHDNDRSSHILTWGGWYQSGNRDVVIPRWVCVDGSRTYDVNNAHWFIDGKFGPLYPADPAERAESLASMQ